MASVWRRWCGSQKQVLPAKHQKKGAKNRKTDNSSNPEELKGFEGRGVAVLEFLNPGPEVA